MKNMEILIVDGMSDDRTQEVIKRYADKNPSIRLLTNAKKITPVALNIGIREAKGDYILILGSHSKVTTSFITKNIETLVKSNVDCVGGVLVTLPANGTAVAKSIAVALSHPFGVGNSYFRIGTKDEKMVDTVPFGCYERKVFQQIGYFDEDLVRNQDDEFNHRLVRHGGKVLLNPNITSYYHARDSLFKLWKMYFQYGYFKPLVSMKTGAVISIRQLVPLFFIGSILISGIMSFFLNSFLYIFLLIGGSYFIANIGVSLFIACKRDLKYLLTLPLTFAILHFSYGFGYIKGFIDFYILKRYKNNIFEDISLSR